MTVFLVIAFLAAVLHVVLEVFADTIGTAIAYAIAGLLCGLVLRTRLAGVRRTLVVWLFAIGFVAGGVWSMKQLIAQVEMIQLVALHGFLATLNPVLVCLAAGVFDRICASVGLESPEEEFERLRVRFECRLR